jgi:diaminopimelate decarboxylase
MNAIVIAHVPVDDLPAWWRAQLARSADTHVTVRIEPESPTNLATDVSFATDDPAFGIWRDRSDMADVAGYLRQLRAPRYHRDGSRHRP